MNRVIKFRGKSINNIGIIGIFDYVVKIGDMVYGDLRTHDECCIDTGEHIVRVAPDTVGQFTGLTDKNGIEIYEGDILRVYYYGKSKVFGVVAFNESRYYVDDEFMRKELKAKAPMAEIFSRYQFEVIGNIHDNPELLEGGEK